MTFSLTLPLRSCARSLMPALLVGALVVTGCPGNQITDLTKEEAGEGGENAGGGDSVPPTVATTTPEANAAGVDPGVTIAATFSEPMDASTINDATFLMDPAIAGSVSYADRTASFTPAAALDHATTYTATITTNATDVSGNAMATSHSWSFSTADPPVAVAEMPLAEGYRWRYEAIESSTVCASSTGCSTAQFDGEYFMRVEEAVEWQGREAWHVLVYRLDGAPGSEPDFRVTPTFLAQDATGLWQWVETGDGAKWRQILSRTMTVFQNATFLLVQGPGDDDDVVLSPSTADVPAGTFETVLAFHEFKQTGRYAPEDIFDSRFEHYAPGVGMVLGAWDYSYDDNDPSGTDIISEGRISLTHMDTGPFPDFVQEVEPNDSTAEAGAASAFAIVTGDTEIDDPGAVLDDAGVGCGTEECVFANADGQKKFQDWYRFELTQTTTMRIELAFELYDSASGVRNDLDLYALEESGTGPRYIGASTDPEGEQEVLTGTFSPGTYYLVVQAWSTPTGRVDYWLSIR